ncbi:MULTISPECIES: hydantoinase/oxoprolinase family protein [Roseomonadaceae]|uniref:Hydantoinase/oxoprolinase family protein n=1 Tax=Falsiroseomonas oleicola TaxID=2801474 RepID=A0ABS6H7E0_9PROT|nr:hydantoinase/oxoprolinase family protein [Roseomonas oleicola]MBU8543401.1 hydantoinase/oxoprolinase family protein [Roseomonas oleicola]
MRIGIDVGGTFTDFVLSGAPGGLVFHKEPSTPADPSAAVESGLVAVVAKAGLAMGDVTLVVHGTTLGLNAIIQRRGGPIGLVTSPGNTDVLEVARCRMPNSVDFHLTKEAALVPRNLCFAIPARLMVDGTVLMRPEPADYDRVAGSLRAAGVATVAVMLLHSYLHPALEAEVARELAARLPGVAISASAQIWPESREYERALVAVLNGFIAPLMQGYFSRLESRLAARGLTAPISITTSNGGSVGLRSAGERPIETVLSGPASGVVAAAQAAAGTRFTQLITLDMGGTSSDIALTKAGEPEYTTRTTVGDFPLVMPVVNVSAIGAGGGSILWVDPQGVLKVGPRSAGAAPGPVCYGRGGTEPTVTDCYLAIGWIDPDAFLGGRMRLDRAAAEAALLPLAARLGFTGADAPARVAEAALAVATAAMATELAKGLAQRGEDASQFALMPFGGAGPTHANLLAEAARLPAVLVPPAPSTFCALGAILADVKRDFVRSLRLRLGAEGAMARLRAALSALSAEATNWLAGEGTMLAGHILSATTEMRYAGQSFELTVDWTAEAFDDPTPDMLAELFHRVHEGVYGFRDTASAVELTSLRVRVTGRMAPVELPAAPMLPSAAPPGTRRVFRAGSWRDVPVWRREALGFGAEVAGPAILEQEDSTLVLLPGWVLRADRQGNLEMLRAATSTP